MKLKAFAIYDSKAEAYSAPFFFPTVGLALRQFEDLSNDTQTTVGKYPSDYTLFEIGTFDDSSGTLVPREANLPLGMALEFTQEESPTWPADPTPAKDKPLNSPASRQ